jgi:hypothetical protein
VLDTLTLKRCDTHRFSEQPGLFYPVTFQWPFIYVRQCEAQETFRLGASGRSDQEMPDVMRRGPVEAV